MNKRLGIDIDGVITNCEVFWREYGSKYLIEHNKRFEYVSTYDLSISYGYKTESKDDKKGFSNFMEYLYPLYANNCEPRPLVREVLTKLMSKGFEPFLITGRHLSSHFHGKTVEEGKQEVYDFLKRYDIPYTDVIFTGGDKVQECVDSSIYLFMDDNPDILEAMNKDGRIKSLCFDNEYNHAYKLSDRIYSWYHYYQYVLDYFV